MNNSHKTAIKRGKMSIPMKYIEHRLQGKILDMGCGHGEDVKYLKDKGHDVVGYDPYYNPVELGSQKFDIVVSNYVINVIYPDEYEMFLASISQRMKDDSELYVSTRSKYEEKSLSHAKRYKQGWITQRGTFQRFFTAEELKREISSYFVTEEIISKNPVILKCKKVKGS